MKFYSLSLSLNIIVSRGNVGQLLAIFSRTGDREGAISDPQYSGITITSEALMPVAKSACHSQYTTIRLLTKDSRYIPPCHCLCVHPDLHRDDSTGLSILSAYFEEILSGHCFLPSAPVNRAGFK